MQLNYTSTHDEQSYIGRIYLFIKRYYWMFLLDILVIIFLILPPYSFEELFVLIALVVLLLIRDFIVLRLSLYHLGSFVAKGNEIVISLLKGNKIKNEIKGWLPDIELEIKYSFGFPVLIINKESEVVFKQYPIGDWSGEKMREFVGSFYDYKKEQNLWKIYKGQE